jgi:phosphoribosylformylglycinamidine synthase
MPYGGVSQLTETQTMVCKLPVGTHNCDAVSMMAYGFDPNLSTWSPYHGAIYAVTQSMARIVSSGGAPDKIRLTFQEYFRRMSEDPKRWSQPFAALLGAYEAQLQYELPSIGGKDSMSGTFNDIDVPPTLVSFAVDMAHEKDIITPELKKAGNSLILLSIPRDAFELPVYASVRKLYNFVHDMILGGHIISAYSIDQYGLAPAISKMAFGNGLGVRIDDERVSAHQLFKPGMGDLVCEIPADHLAAIENKLSEIGLADFMIRVGEVTDDAQITYGSTKITIDEAIDSWKATLDGVFATKASDDTTAITTPEYHEKNIYVCKNKVAKPRVFIPVFPGTNCEYDSARSFELAGAEADVRVFKNLSAQDITDSAAEFAKGIDAAQMMMFPGGFSAGDEPEGSAKFFASAYRNEVIKEAVDRLLSRDGLILGICNGFQALIKLGLVPYGQIHTQQVDSPTLTFNTIGRHISKMATTKVVSNKSPWLAQATLGGTYVVPASHGEGRFVADAAWMKKLFENGQVATQYVNEAGNPTMDEEWNINGSYCSIEGITSPDGRVLGKMCHSERIGDSVAVNIYGEQDMKIFESGVAYFK